MASLAKWSSVRLRTKCFWVWVQLQSLKLQFYCSMHSLIMEIYFKMVELNVTKFVSIMGWTGLKQYFFRFFRVTKTHDALTFVKKVYWKEYKTIPSQNVFENCQAYQFKILCTILSEASVTIGTLARKMKTLTACFDYLLTKYF